MRFNKYFTLIVAAFALAACDKNNDELNIDETKDTPITILSAGVADLSTRAITDEGELVGTSEDETVSIGVFITGATNNKYNYDNIDYTHNGESWSGGGILYEGSGSTQQISAYYPYTEDISDDGFTVTADGTTDYLVATPVPMTSSEVTLTMKHALAKLVLKATFGSEITNTNISKVEVGSMYTSGIWKVSDNTWSDLSGATTLEMTDNEVLVIPMAECTSFPITITMEDGREFKTDVSLSSVESKLEAGTQYNIKLQIGQDLVALDGITVSPWTSEDGGALGTE